jgi:hypothetical protein
MAGRFVPGAWALVVSIAFMAGVGADSPTTMPSERGTLAEGAYPGVSQMIGDENLDGDLSRVGQPDLPAIVFEGRKYEQIMDGDALDLPQRTGFLAVFDAETGARMALVKVYDVVFDPTTEADVQDVFFVRMEFDEAERTIVVENEHGDIFHVSVDDLTSTPAE